MAISEEENERSNENMTARNVDGSSENYNASLLKPTSTGKYSSTTNHPKHKIDAVGGSHDNFKPVEVRCIDGDESDKNRIMIQKESQVTRSLTENLASMLEQRNRRLDLTE